MKPLITLTTAARVSELPRVNAFLDDLLAGCDCAPDLKSRLQLAAEEVFVNVASYAYPSGDGEIRIAAAVGGDPLTVTLTFSDDGVPFDPLRKPDADTSPEALSTRVGGLGILMVKKLTDDVTYARRAGQNVLTVKKILV